MLQCAVDYKLKTHYCRPHSSNPVDTSSPPDGDEQAPPALGTAQPDVAPQQAQASSEAQIVLNAHAVLTGAGEADAGGHSAADVLAAVDLALLPFRNGRGTSAALPHKPAPIQQELWSSRDVNAVATWLSRQPDWRVLRKLVPLPPSADGSAQEGVLRVAFLDLVANPARQGRPVADLAAAVVGFTAQPWRLMGLMDSFSSHGELTDAASSKFTRLMRQVNLVVVHGAEAVRPLLEVQFPGLAGVPWACSREEVAWTGSPNLEVQMMRLGYFLDVHSTLQRAHALARLVSVGAVRSDNGERSLMQALLESSQRVDMRLLYKVDSSPKVSMSGKDEAIMALGMRWDDRLSAYAMEVESRQQANSCIRQLADITGCEGRISIETRDALVRYSGRRAELKWTTTI